ncbi:MAG TPA: DUF6282 family protein [Candidatus Binatia bacterium]|jgi:hypothetical protein|nr:DUF6282 family protein [Candidatus Binatia bacterium]
MPITELLEGAFDLHVHTAPDCQERKQSADEYVQDLLRHRMGGALLKDHTTITADRAQILRERYPQLGLFGAVVLNYPVGGLNPVAVETALRLGAKFIFMPTYSSALNVRLFGFAHPALPYPFPRHAEGISLLDHKGHLRWEVIEICELIAGFDACLATGHVSPEEALALVKAAHEIGVRRISITHASLPFLGLSPDLQIELARLGAVIEHSFVVCTALNPQPLPIAEIADQVLTVGPEHCTLSTDLGQVLNPPPVEGFTTFAAGLQQEGISANQLRRMIVDNPHMLLGI